MDSQLDNTIRANFENKPTSELLTILESNNQEEYPLETLEAVRQILLTRNQTLPPQKDFGKRELLQCPKCGSQSLKRADVPSFLIFLVVSIICFFLYILLIASMSDQFGRVEIESTEARIAAVAKAVGIIAVLGILLKLWPVAKGKRVCTRCLHKFYPSILKSGSWKNAAEERRRLGYTDKP